MNPSPYALVIFDCDGVLIDSELIASRVDAQVLTEAGYPITPEELATSAAGISQQQELDRLAAKFGRPAPPGLNTLRNDRIMAAFATELRPMPGVIDVLNQLTLPRCVASSSPAARIAFALKITGLLPFFDGHLFDAAMVPRGKPAPDLFLHAAQQMNADPTQCVVIEDSPSGVTGAKAAGMQVIGFIGGSHCRPNHDQRLRNAGADHIIKVMAQLPPLLLG